MAPVTVRRAPYKDFLQPALHRRFSTTALIILGIAYFESFSLAPWNSWLWSWFPIGPTGIRAFFIFICGLFIIILRIAQYHVGVRTSISALDTFRENALKLQTLETLLSYTLSSYLFSQVYIWSAPTSANVSWITYYNGDRPRLNEKAIFITAHFIMFGVYGALVHLIRDDDRLTLGVVQPRKEGTAKVAARDAGSQLKKLWERIPEIVGSSVTTSLWVVVFSAAVYPFLFRSLAWGSTRWFFKMVYNLPKAKSLPLSWPYDWWVILRSLLATSMLSLIWVAGNKAFSMFLVRDPIKNGKPLTSDSKDPNGSLLNGLKSKKLPIKCFAVWELAHIACDHDVRRKAIYEDIDRKDGPVWSQISAICLGIIKELDTRVDSHTKPPQSAPPAEASTREGELIHNVISHPPKSENIVNTPPKNMFRAEVEKYVGNVVRDPSQPSRLSPIGKAVGEKKDALLGLGNTAENQYPFQDKICDLLRSPLGWPFRQQFSRRLNAIVFGGPYGEASLYINATVALSQLAVRSLQEDKYGNVQRDVASVIRTLTAVAKRLDDFKQSLPFHWTDVYKQRQCPEVESVIEALKDALSDLVLNFEPYRRDLRLTLAEVRQAKEAIGGAQPDMPVVEAAPQASQPTRSRRTREMEQLR